MRHSLVHVWVFVCLFGTLVVASSRGQKTPQPPVSRIEAESAPYRIVWDGEIGTFTQNAEGEVPQKKTPLIFLHNDPGPIGVSKHISWFIAREKKSFSILWCYLNVSGKDFSCWLYRYPQNQLVPVRFTGDYLFSPSAEPAPSAEEIEFSLSDTPKYTGPHFTFQNWTSTSGSLDSLKLTPARASSSSKGSIETSLSLSKLTIHPLHHIQVGAGNGWRANGWTELHALAHDENESPFYLILYSNSARGYAIDLKHAKTYTAEFGERVQFGKSEGLDSKENSSVTAIPRVKKWDRFESSFTSKAAFANPYTEGQVSFIMKSPEGKTTLVPGFWDGGTTWKLRFAPAKLGTWSFQSLSKTEDLNGKNGNFECVNENEDMKGFIGVQPSYQNPRHFSYSNGDPFLPVPILGDIGEFASDGNSLFTEKKGQLDFSSFQRQIDSLAAAGFNRLIGGFLIPDNKANRFPFADLKLEALELSYFQWLDKRVAYCNSKGIVPDIGLGVADDSLFQRFGSENLFRFWGYMLSRYAAYDVVWNLYERDGREISQQTRKNLTELAELTRLYDPYHHIRTAITPGAAAAVSATAGDSFASGAIPNYGRWQDCITVRGGDLNAIPAFQKENKPLIILDAGSGKRIPKDLARRRMWESRFQGAYWVGDIQAFEPGATSDPVWKSSAEAGAFFKTTKFSRLSPSQELLRGDEENPSDRKRRQKAEELIQKANPLKEPNPNANSPRFILANPAREYAVYFEKGGTILLDLLEATGRIVVSWRNPRTGEALQESVVYGGGFVQFSAPDANDWILRLSRR